MKDFEEEIVDNGEILNIVKEIKILINKDRYYKDSIKDLEKNIQIKLKNYKKLYLFVKVKMILKL